MPRIKALLREIDRGFNRWDNIEDPYGLPIDEFQKENGQINRVIGMSMMYDATKDYYTNIEDEEHF